MRSLWDEGEAGGYEGLLGQRVYTSRLLGRDHDLVLHGGGNTSVKVRERDIFGDEQVILYVKGSGWDLQTIEAAGFAPVRLERALKLASLDHLADAQMVRELRAAMTDPSAPTPSVETILHAVLPYTFVDHTHADALLAITNTADGEARVREIYGGSVVVIPYVMPGFDLAKVCADVFPRDATSRTVGMVLLKHGFFSFGDTAREAYERMLDLVREAEQYLERRGAWHVSLPDEAPPAAPSREELAALRAEVSATASAPLIMVTDSNPRPAAFARRPDVAVISQPLTTSSAPSARPCSGAKSRASAPPTSATLPSTRVARR
jgi:rhamnose utilization protein RhaD (predicted bifunctional aldolase and dehydrogenase)